MISPTQWEEPQKHTNFRFHLCETQTQAKAVHGARSQGTVSHREEEADSDGGGGDGIFCFTWMMAMALQFNM